MRNLLKLNVIILMFSIIFTSQAVAAERILPVPKPTVDQETKKETAKKKEIYPQKKPAKKAEKIAEAEEEQIIEIEIPESEVERIDSPIAEPEIAENNTQTSIDPVPIIITLSIIFGISLSMLLIKIINSRVIPQ